MRLPRRATTMPEAEFWSLIELLGGRVDDTGVSALTATLQAQGGKASRRFAERLAAVLYELDREVLAERTIRWADSPDDPPIPLSDDSFPYLRCAVVAAGRSAVDAVLADPAVLESRLWDDGEALLYAADVEVDTAVSYETASNTRYWTPRPDDGPVERPLVAILLEDLLAPIEGWHDAYAEPTWLPRSVLSAAENTAAAHVRAAGGPPDGLRKTGVQVRIGLGVRWQLGPAPGEDLQQVMGWGLAPCPRRELPRDVVRAWRPDQQRTGLLAVVAGCLLTVLPDDHAARAALQQSVQAAAELLPTS